MQIVTKIICKMLLTVRTKNCLRIDEWQNNSGIKKMSEKATKELWRPDSVGMRGRLDRGHSKEIEEPTFEL
jgi:hypothetical protein